MMEYKGFYGVVEYDEQMRLFHGEIVNTRDVITFQGESVDELEKALRESVDDYREWCAEEGVDPDKPYSGKFNLRLSPELHRELAIAAKKLDISINRFVEKAIEDEIRIVKT